MKRPYLLLLLLAVLYSFQSFSAGIKFVENKAWKEILAMAKKENKLIFLDAYATWCGPCKYLQQKVFTNKNVGAYYNSNFINVAIDMEEGEGLTLSEELGVTSYPTLFFINGDGEPVHKTVGAMEADDFISLGKAALNPDKQYFTVRSKAAQGKISPAAFHDWVHEAENMEDAQLASIIESYLSKGQYPLMEEEMLSLVMDHASSLSKSQIDQLYANRVQAAKMLEVTELQFNEALLDFVVKYARVQSAKSGIIDFAAFKKQVAHYYPKKADLETQKMKVSWYVEREDAEKACSALSELMKSYIDEAPLEDICMSVVDATPLIVQQKKGPEFVKKVENLKVREAEKNKAYYKDLALMMLHFMMEDLANMEKYADRILENEEAPETIKNLVLGFLEE